MSGERIQAAAVPYRLSPFGDYEVLLVSRTKGGWGLPKGGVKRLQTPAQTAALETLEEAGVLGEIEPRLGWFRYRKQGRKNLVHVYPLRVERVLARWEEEGKRVRVWVSMTEAPRLLHRDELERFLIDLRHQLLARARQPPLRFAA